MDVSDRRIARIVQQCQDLPGHELFQYVDETGARQTIDSADVNQYLKAITGLDFTAKDFRTWAGTVCASLTLSQDTNGGPPTKKAVTACVAAVADRLGNTPAISRKCYIHPTVLEAYLEGALAREMHVRPVSGHAARERLAAEEGAVLTFLKRRARGAVGRLGRASRNGWRPARAART